MNTRPYLAELLGTFLFFSIGYLSVADFGAVEGVPSLLVVPFSFGFGLLAAIFAFGHVSGGHFNPAVTVAAVVDGRTTPQDAVGYIVAQIVGALAAGLLVMVTVSQAAVAAGITAPGEGITDVGALLIEIAMTAGFVAVILAATKHAQALAALAIPLSLVAIHFASATLSGASVNPARSLGSAVIGGDLGVIWIYLVGPIVGGVLGALIYRFAAAEASEPSGPTEASAGGSPVPGEGPYPAND
jgi:MIP family channel proteins